jgi:Fe-S cluster assembly ATPase SufC
VKTGELVKLINNGGKSTEDIAESLDVSECLNRDINLWFSGGEIKNANSSRL